MGNAQQQVSCKSDSAFHTPHTHTHILSEISYLINLTRAGTVYCVLKYFFTSHLEVLGCPILYYFSITQNHDSEGGGRYKQKHCLQTPISTGSPQLCREAHKPEPLMSRSSFSRRYCCPLTTPPPEKKTFLWFTGWQLWYIY